MMQDLKPLLLAVQKNLTQEDEYLEFTDSMIERMDEMDQAVYQICLTLLELENEEDYAKRFPWNIGIVEEMIRIKTINIEGREIERTFESVS